MTPVLKHLIFASVFLLLASSASINAAPPGFVEGHLKIISPKEVELADGNAPAITAENYAEYPLIMRKRVRGKPQQFVVASNQTVRVDMEIDTGVR